MVSPMGLCIAQRHAQLAERTAESAMSSVGHIAEVTRQVYGFAEVAIAGATSVESQVEGRIATLTENAEANTSCTIGEMSQRLEQGLEVVALGTIMTSAQNKQVTIEGLCVELQAEQNQYQVESQQQ